MHADMQNAIIVGLANSWGMLEEWMKSWQNHRTQGMVRVGVM